MSNLISIGQIVDRSIERYRAHGKELFGIALWMVVAFIPLAVSSLLVPGVETSLSRQALLALLNLGGSIVVTVVSIRVAISLILAIDKAEHGKPVDTRSIGKTAWSLFIPFALISGLIALIVSGIALLAAPGFILMLVGAFTSSDTFAAAGLPLFFLGAIVASILIIKMCVELAFAQYSLLLNPNGKPLSWNAMKSALRASRDLVRGKWWSTMFRIIIPNMIFSLVTFALTYLLSLGAGILLAVNAGSLPSLVVTLGAVVISLVMIAVNALAMPLYSIAAYTLYDSLKQSGRS